MRFSHEKYETPTKISTQHHAVPLTSQQQQSSASSSSLLVSSLIAFLICFLLHNSVLSKVFESDEILQHENDLLMSKGISFHDRHESHNLPSIHQQSDISNNKNTEQILMRQHRNSNKKQNNNNNILHYSSPAPFSSLSFRKNTIKSVADLESGNSKMQPKLQGWKDLISAAPTTSANGDAGADLDQLSTVIFDSNNDNRFTCVGWLATSPRSCSQRRPEFDKDCSNVIVDTTTSSVTSGQPTTGYCQCFDYNARKYVKVGEELCSVTRKNSNNDGDESIAFTCHDLCKSEEHRQQLSKLLSTKGSSALSQGERQMLLQKHARRNRMTSGNQRQKQQDSEEIEQFLVAEANKRREEEIMRNIVYKSEENFENERRSLYREVEDFASKRANLFRKLRAKHEREMNHNHLHHLQCCGRIGAVELEEIEGMVAGGFAGNRIDEAFEEEVNDKVKHASV